jgi:predicted alpha/beta-fold hydrolase
MNEDIQTEIGRNPPKWARNVRVQRLSLNFRGNSHTGKVQLDRTTLQLGRGLLSIEYWRMHKPNKPTWIIVLRLVGVIVDQPTGGEIWLIKPRSARQYGHVDADMVHHSQVRR